jgi:hypothetical protein
MGGTVMTFYMSAFLVQCNRKYCNAQQAPFMGIGTRVGDLALEQFCG